MLEPFTACADPRAEARHRRARSWGAGRTRLLVWAAVLALGGCSIPFGPGGESSGGSSSPETPRDRNRLYLQEQERMERNVQFDRVGPPSDR